ncbi:MAG: PilT/PilU family type 4a pilus ATPase [Bdellovibrionales bacterium]|nr:PilT/PilU family type 4a pilus ATPase [Bdellovibrionales bacterium]
MSGSAARKLASADDFSIEYLVHALMSYGASDLHIKTGRPPCFRIDGKLIPAKSGPMTHESIERLVGSVLSPRHIQELEQNWQVDASFRLENVGRFRCNVYRQRNTLSAVIRMIPFQTLRLEDLGAPAVLKELGRRESGILLIAGPTGSGKSTTLASLVQYLNETQAIHIITIEDPIEFVFQDLRASVTQREVGSDTRSTQEALRAGLRQDPDVIVVGEMRDYETIRVALTAAETGHLVLSTLHAPDATGAIGRILDVVPGDAQNQIRVQLSSSLVGVVAQQLVPRSSGDGRVLAAEVMVNSPAIQEAIAENALDRVAELMASSNDYYQMQTLNQALLRLIESEAITLTEAKKISPRPEELDQSLSGIVRG